MAIRLQHETLKKYTTFNIGGPAEILSFPTSVEDLISEITFCRQNKIEYRILGNGSNILVADKGVKGFIIKLDKACNHLKLKNKNTIEVGSGVNLQKFINYSIKKKLGGNEGLISIPGTIGGAIYMNAGLGKNEELSISHYLKSVTVFDNETVRAHEKEACDFTHRHSIFQKNKHWIILSAIFELPSQQMSVGLKKRDERMKFVKKHQDRHLPNVGTIFRKNYAPLVASIVRGKKIGGACFAKHNGNWINNTGNASAKDVIRLIKVARFLNFLFFKNAQLEIEIWQ